MRYWLNIKYKLKRNKAFYGLWSFYQAWKLKRDYEQRREYYASLAQNNSITYREGEVVKDIRQRLKSRGYSPILRKKGDVHTFAIIPQQYWHHHLIPDLRIWGPVSLFDYVSLGYAPETFQAAKWDKARIARRQEMVNKIFPAFYKAHKQRPVDWVLCYGGGHKISATVIRKIIADFGVPVVNMTFDDKQGWVGPDVGEHKAGGRDLTAALDIFFTSAMVACEWHLLEGGRPIYMPEGFNDAAYHPRPVRKDIQVSFVGAAYGFRASVVEYIRKHGIPVQTFGAGWSGTGFIKDIVDIFNRSSINLGMGGIGYSEDLTNVKGRDFEIPGTGGGVYLTSFNPDLAKHFIIGEEILCYRNRDEMLELIRYYLAHPNEAQEIARRGRERCLREHRWEHRYHKALRILEITS